MKIMLVALLFATPVWACDQPIKPTVPDGASATEERMVQAQTEVKVYMSVANEFLACTEKEIKTAATKAEKSRLNQAYNTVVEQMGTLGKEFNASVKAFKAR